MRNRRHCVFTDVRQCMRARHIRSVFPALGEARCTKFVPGKKVDHKGLILNPQPHQIVTMAGKTCDLSQGINLKDKQGKFAGYLDFLSPNKKGVKLTIDFGQKVAGKANVKAVSGAYALVVNEKGITITGFDERGAFYGIQTLKQLVESPVSSGSALPFVEINDYPDLPNRGVVEGFYGTPWSHEVRLSLIDFYGKFKMNSYLYGPKDDHYHNLSELAIALSGERGATHQGTGGCLQPQLRGFCMGHPSGTGHQVERGRLSEPDQQVQLDV